jgi:hypothetical protein
LPTLLLAASLCVAARCAGLYFDRGDPMLHLDAVDAKTQHFLEMPPEGRPLAPGPDGIPGTEDDVLLGYVSGDVDLVLRTGMTSFSGPIPDPTVEGGLAPLPVAVAEPFGDGTPIEFAVAASDNWGADSSFGNAIDPPSLANAPVLAVAFGDLDGDGYVGVTSLDGNALDTSLEEEELRPVGRQFAFASGGRAGGSVAIAAGGPTGAELLVAVGAAAYAGPFDPQHFGGAVPKGPMVMTHLPFLPRTRPDRVLDGPLPGPADPNAIVGVQIEPGLVPDPAVPTLAERFTVYPSRHRQTADFAHAHSGAFARFGLGRVPVPATYRDLPGRPLRPALDDAGGRIVLEVLQQLSLPDDGAASKGAARVVPLDRLGNVADLESGSTVTLRAEGGVAIVSPDNDGFADRESFTVSNARGRTVVLDDLGSGVFDDEDGAVEVESSAGLLRLDVFLPDPDVDDDGAVDSADEDAVDALNGLRLGEPGYDARFDLTGDGRIDGDDADVVGAHRGDSIPVP